MPDGAKKGKGEKHKCCKNYYKIEKRVKNILICIGNMRYNNIE